MGICQEEKTNRKNQKFEGIKNDEFNNFVQNYQYYKKIIGKKEINLIYNLEKYNQNDLTEIIKSFEEILKNDLPENENTKYYQSNIKMKKILIMI
jgi:hypothetical protein